MYNDMFWWARRKIREAVDVLGAPASLRTSPDDKGCIRVIAEMDNNLVKDVTSAQRTSSHAIFVARFGFSKPLYPEKLKARENLMHQYLCRSLPQRDPAPQRCLRRDRPCQRHQQRVQRNFRAWELLRHEQQIITILQSNISFAGKACWHKSCRYARWNTISKASPRKYTHIMLFVWTTRPWRTYRAFLQPTRTVFCTRGDDWMWRSWNLPLLQCSFSTPRRY